MHLVLLLKYSLLWYPGQQARHPLLSHPLLNPVDVLSRPLQVPVAVLSRQLPGPVPVPGRQHLPGRPHSRARQLLLSRDPLLTCHLPSPVPLLSPSGLSHLLSRPKLPSLSGPSHLSTRPSLLVWEATGSLWWFSSHVPVERPGTTGPHVWTCRTTQTSHLTRTYDPPTTSSDDANDEWKN